MSSTPHVSRSRKIRGVAVAALAVALIAAAFSGEGAQATGTTVTVFGSPSDTGVVDTNGDGAAEWNSYGPTNNGLAVGEQRADGFDLRYVVPFTLSDSVRAGLANGATAKLRFRIWQVSELGARQLKVDALEGDLQGRADYARTGIEAGAMTPIQTLGGTPAEMDVTDLLRNVSGPVVTFRFSLDTPGQVDGLRTFVNIATMESGRAENRPQLLVTIPDAVKPTAPTTATTATTATTKPPATAPPATTPPTTAKPPATVPATTPTTPAPSTDGWKLTWADEFNGTSLDTSKWNYDGSTFGDGNKEIACLRPSNVTVGNGTMKITAKHEQNVCPNETRPAEFPNGRPWSSASINTSGKFSQAEGRFEIRAKLPKGAGFWPAYWMTSQYYPFGGNGASGELDVFEIFGQSTTDLLTSALWSYDSGSVCANGSRWSCTLINKHSSIPDSSAGYHLYALEWDTTSIRWYFDNVKVFEIGDGMQYKWSSAAPYPNPGAPQYPKPFVDTNPMKLRVNLAVGGVGGGATNSSTPSSASYDVDYVRVYSH